MWHILLIVTLRLVHYYPRLVLCLCFDYHLQTPRHTGIVGDLLPEIGDRLKSV